MQPQAAQGRCMRKRLNSKKGRSVCGCMAPREDGLNFDGLDGGNLESLNGIVDLSMKGTPGKECDASDSTLDPAEQMLLVRREKNR